MAASDNKQSATSPSPGRRRSIWELMEAFHLFELPIVSIKAREEVKMVEPPVLVIANRTKVIPGRSRRLR